MTGFPSICGNCGASLYAQWWSRVDTAYKCRTCGTLNPGPAPAQMSAGLVASGLVVSWAIVLVSGALLAASWIGYDPAADAQQQEPGLVAVALGLFTLAWLGLLVVVAGLTWVTWRRRRP